MPIGKKELKLIAILCVVAYALVFYKLIWRSVLPSIKSVQGDIAAALDKRELLEKDYRNVNLYKTQLAAKTTSSERIDEYLMSSANMVDSLEYVDKLTRLIGDNIREMNIGRPEEKYAINGKNPAADDMELKENFDKNRIYYEIKMDFRAFMTYSSAMELVKYIEGGTRRVKITKFFVKALSDGDMKALTESRAKQEQDKAGTAAETSQTAANKETGSNTAVQNVSTQDGAAPSSLQKTGASEGKLFDTNMTISIYSTNLRASDRMYEYSRHKLNRFIYTNGIFMASSGSGEGLADGPDTMSSLNEEFGASDIIISERSYLAAGENLKIFGVDRENNNIRLKTNSTTEIRISLTGNSYFIDTFEGGKKSFGIMGSLPDKSVVTIAVSVDMPAIKENDNIRLNIKVNNNSGKDLNITLDDQQKRVALFDRKGNEIHSDSTAESARII